MIQSLLNYFILNLKIQGRTKSATLTPLLFSLVLIVVFNFTIGNLEPDIQKKVFSLLGLIITFFGLQILYMQSFKNETDDFALDLLLTAPISSSMLFLAKLMQFTLQSLFIYIASTACLCFLNPITSSVVLDPIVILANLVAIIALTAMGVLLTTVLSASSHFLQLYPLTYFPLTAPVLIIASTVTYQASSANNTLELQSPWIWLLCGISVIYISLGYIAFGVFFDSDT